MDGLLRLKAQLEGADFDYNPYLRKWEHSQPNQRAGEGQIQNPAEPKDIIWQTRSHAPTDAEDALGDALEKVLEDGAETLGQVAEGLNKQGLRAPDGATWTEKTLAAEFKRLGA